MESAVASLVDTTMEKLDAGKDNCAPYGSTLRTGQASEGTQVCGRHEARCAVDMRWDERDTRWGMLGCPSDYLRC